MSATGMGGGVCDKLARHLPSLLWSDLREVLSLDQNKFE